MKEAETSAGSGRELLLAAIPFVAAVLLYLPARRYGFIFDDNVEMLNFEGLFTPGEWSRLLVRAQYGLYRPVKYISLHFDHARGGWNPAPFHLTNILLHAAVCSLVHVLLRMLRASPPAALVGSLLFALHPIHVEPVVWITSRGSMLSAIGALGVAISHMRLRSGGSAVWFPALVLCALFGFLSKEDALMVIPALAAVELWAFPGERGDRRRTALSLVILTLTAAGYIAVRQSILGRVEQGTWPHGFSGMLSTLPGILLRYLGQMILPLGMTLEPRIDYSRGFGVVFVVQALAFAGILAAVFVPRRPALDAARLSLAWFLLFLAPAAGFIPINAPAADRFLYLPSVSVAILVARVWDKFPQWRTPPLRPLAVAAVITGGVYVMMARDYMPVWANDERLWLHVVERNDRSWRAWNNLAVENNKKGEHDQALLMAENSLRFNPDYIEALITRGRALNALGRGAEAGDSFERALALNPSNPVAIHMYADYLDRADRTDEALVQYERLFEIQPGNATARNAVAIIEILRGNRAAAIAHWEAALRADPSHETSRRNLARARAEEAAASRQASGGDHSPSSED